MKLVLFIKTFRDDIVVFQRLLSSISQHNKDNIPLVVSVPESDYALFAHFADSTHIKIITDESYCGEYLLSEDLDTGYSKGYINQEICKLCFYRVCEAENYFSLDSDGVFICDFYEKDFIHPDGSPYICLIQDKELAIATWYGPYESCFGHRQERIKTIYECVGLADPRLRTCHGFQIMNCRVLHSMYTDFMLVHGYSYIDLMRIAPLEYSWYNAWFQRCRLVPEYAIEPLFRCIHNREQYNLDKYANITMTSIRRMYLGIIMNSNWSHNEDFGALSYKHYSFYKKYIKAKKKKGWERGSIFILEVAMESAKKLYSLRGVFNRLKRILGGGAEIYSCSSLCSL